MVQQPMRCISLLVTCLFLVACNPEDSWPDRIDLTEDQGVAVLQEAEAYTGVPYEWGGNSMSGMDCSGLIVEAMYAVFERGFLNQDGEISREVNANELVRYNGRPVSEPRRGDWVAFDTNWDGVYEHISIFDSFATDDDGNDTIRIFDASEAGNGVVEYRLIEDLDEKYHYFVRPMRVQ